MNSMLVRLVAVVFFCSHVAEAQRVEHLVLQESNARSNGWNFDPAFPENVAGEKSPMVAVLLSLALPGAGEWYAGSFSTGKYFMMADGAMWLTYATFEYRGDWLREDSRSHAMQHARANFTGKDGQFAVNVGDYDGVDAYNQAKLRNRQFDQLYTESHQSWRWDSEAHRRSYRDMRIRSERMYQNAKFVVAGLVINRLVSAFSAGRAAARYPGVTSELGWRLHAGMGNNPVDVSGISVNLSTNF
jgi:hypothetical protein